MEQQSSSCAESIGGAGELVERWSWRRFLWRQRWRFLETSWSGSSYRIVSESDCFLKHEDRRAQESRGVADGELGSCAVGEASCRCRPMSSHHRPKTPLTSDLRFVVRQPSHPVGRASEQSRQKKSSGSFN